MLPSSSSLIRTHKRTTIFFFLHHLKGGWDQNDNDLGTYAPDSPRLGFATASIGMMALGFLPKRTHRIVPRTKHCPEYRVTVQPLVLAKGLCLCSDLVWATGYEAVWGTTHGLPLPPASSTYLHLPNGRMRGGHHLHVDHIAPLSISLSLAKIAWGRDRISLGDQTKGPLNHLLGLLATRQRAHIVCM